MRLFSQLHISCFLHYKHSKLDNSTALKSIKHINHFKVNELNIYPSNIRNVFEKKRVGSSSRMHFSNGGNLWDNKCVYKYQCMHIYTHTPVSISSFILGEIILHTYSWIIFVFVVRISSATSVALF